MGELQLDDLMREHKELEPEVELREAASGDELNASIAGTPPGGSSTRLAHTLRRGRSDVSAMQRVERSAGLEIPRLFDRDLEDPTAILQAPLAAALASRTMPEAYRARGSEPLGTPGAGSAKASSELAIHSAETRLLEAPPSTVVPYHPSRHPGRHPGSRPDSSSAPRRVDRLPRPPLEPGTTGSLPRPPLEPGTTGSLPRAALEPTTGSLPRPPFEPGTTGSLPRAALEPGPTGETRFPVLRSDWRSRLRGAWQALLRSDWRSRLRDAWQALLRSDWRSRLRSALQSPVIVPVTLLAVFSAVYLLLRAIL